jgi:hypothetical protein
MIVPTVNDKSVSDTIGNDKIVIDKTDCGKAIIDKTDCGKNNPDGLSTNAPHFFMNEPPARLTVFIGAYGSGKSEIAVNYALALKTTGRAVVLADLDMINPFFRSADAQKYLETAGIELIKPFYANTQVDVPAVPSAVFSLFDRTDRFGVLDIGGEDLGARVLASLHNRFPDENSANRANILLVVNTCRPFTATPEQIAEMAAALTTAGNVKINGMINNTMRPCFLNRKLSLKGHRA